MIFFINRIAAQIYVTACTAAISFMTVESVKAGQPMEEQRRRQYTVHGEKPPTRFIGTGYEHIPAKEPEPPIFNIGF